MKRMRGVERVWGSRPTLEGAGVRLKRAIGPEEAQRLDPFLMLDDIHSSDPRDYMAGFPMHPHRGMETVTYMVRGAMEHRDSIGNHGVIESGDVQWMTAGSGILHQEMPRRFEGALQGFQLWVNLPRERKMMPPRYRDIKGSAIPVFRPEAGVEVKVVAGKVDGVQGPVRDLVMDVEYLDVKLAAGMDFAHAVPEGRHAFAYVFEGSGYFEEGSKHKVGAEQLVLFSDGEEIWADAGEEGVRFLFASGAPINEPIAWGGPMVMNSRAELNQAFEELKKGTFVKGERSSDGPRDDLE